MRRLLVLSYYFPPLGLSGVQRTVKFVKYLPEHGWETIVVSPRHKGNYVYDRTLSDEVQGSRIHRTCSLDPLYLSPAGNASLSPQNSSLASAVNRWFLPDNKIGWLPFAVATALKAFRRYGADAIYSTAPPYSSHLAAVLVKKLTGRPLIADFRDAWTDYTWVNHPTKVHKRIDLSLENLVLRNSNRILCVNDEILNGLRKAHPDVAPHKFRLIPHGYDPQDFTGQEVPFAETFRIAYSGTFIKNRNPHLLLEAVEILGKRQPKFLKEVTVSLAGTLRKCDELLIRSFPFPDKIEIKGYLSHRESVSLLMKSALLWLVMGPEETPNVTPGKLFEYLGANKPIVASVPPGATAHIINQTSAGTVVPPDSAQALAAALEGYYNDWKKGKPLFHGKPDVLKNYNRRLITGQLARLLDELV
jgi:glycosyltransferase involved in cell wall biosynthesis